MTSHATRTEGPDGSDPIPAIHDHELRIQKLEEILSFRAGNSIGKTGISKDQMESIIATKHPPFSIPSDDYFDVLRYAKGEENIPQRIIRKTIEVERAAGEAHIRAELIRLGWTPPEEKAQDSAHPLPGSSPEIANMVKAINEGQTDSPLKKSDRPRIECLTIHGILPPPGPIVSFDGSWNPAQNKAAEPAPGSDAEHPPEGYRLAKVGEKRETGYLAWMSHGGEKESWAEPVRCYLGMEVKCENFIANPIPANEGDSQKEEYGEEWQEAGLTASMMWDVIQSMRKALDCDGTTTPVERAERVMRNVAELRATVERLTSELDTTKRLLAESLVERDRLKNLHDARKVRFDSFRAALDALRAQGKEKP